MSRARLLQRAANWLKNCISTRKQIDLSRQRQKAFKFAFGQLEERVVLNADFSFDGVNVLMNNYSSLGAESLTVGETATHYQFSLAEGTWNGVDGASVFGNGTSTLSVDKTFGGSTITSDGAAINVSFGAVDFDAAGTLTDISFTGADFTQTGAIDADTVNNVSFTGDSIRLENALNDLSAVTFDATSVRFDDANSVDVTTTTTGETQIDAAGTINVLNSSVGSVLDVDSRANGGAGGDITLTNSTGNVVILTGGGGDLDLTDLGNDWNSYVVNSGSKVDIFDPNTARLRGITADSLTVDAVNIDVQLDVNVSQILFDGSFVFQSSVNTITADELSVVSTGNVSFGLSNHAIGKLAADVGGDLILKNSVNMDIDELTVDFIDGSSTTTTGATVAGDIEIEMIGLDLVSVQPIDVAGNFKLTLGTGCADLSNSANDFNAVNIVSASQVDLFDQDDVSITGAQLSSMVAVVAGNDINLDGNVDAADQILFVALNNLNQNSGILKSAGLMFAVGGDATLEQANEIGTATVDGLVSGNVTGDLFFNNTFGIDIVDQTYLLKNGGSSNINGLAGDTVCLHAPSITITSATFSASNLVIESNGGIVLPAITVGDLILKTTGNVDALGANQIDRIAVDIDGNFRLNNTVDIEIADLNLCSVQVVGLNVTGDWDVTLTNDDLGQSADAMVGGLSTIAVGGTGNVDLSRANNDFGSVNIVSSDTVMIVDKNAIEITGANGNDHDYTSGGAMTLSGNLLVGNSVGLNSMGGVNQTAGIIDTDSLSVTGEGLFSLGNLNDIGGGLPGQLSLDIADGDFLLINDQPLELKSIASVLAGVNNGNVTISTTDDDIKQDSTTPVIFAGTTILDVGTGKVCLEFGDGDADTLNDNDFNIVNVLNSTVTEIVDTNDMTVNDAVTSDKLILETEFGDMTLTGNIVAPNGLILLSGGGINQTGGSITAPQVVVDAGLDALLGQTNSIGNGAPGVIAGQAGGELFINSQFGLQVNTVTLTRKDGTVVTLTGLDAAKIHLKALNILFTAAANATDNIVLDSAGGVAQNINGILRAAGIVLLGNGDFFLTEANEIGSAIDPGKFAADVLGTINFENQFGLLVASIACGPTTYVGVNVGTGGGTYSGDLILNTSANNGDIRQEADANVVVEGDARFDVGTGNICLNKGDTDADLVTNNDFSLLFVDSARIVEIADINDISVESVNISDALSIDAGGAITLNNDIVVPSVHLKAGNGVSQLASTFIDSMQVILQGDGDFNLTERNRIGDIFTDGKFAADVNGSITLLNDFDLLIDDLTYTFKDGSSTNVSGVTVNTGTSTGDFTVTTSQDDISQTVAGRVVVAGQSTFDVGVATVGLAVAGTNDFNDVRVIAADEAEIADGTDGMTLLDITVGDQSFMSTAGLLSIVGNIDSGSRFLVESAGGAFQSISSVLTTGELLVQGTGDFSFEQANNIQNLGGLGVIAVDVNGSFAVQNGVNTQVETLSYTKLNGTVKQLMGVDVTGDFGVTLPDADFTQASDSAFIALGTSTFDVGTGCVDLTFGDENSDTLNENDFNNVVIASARVVDLVDVNGFMIGNSVVSDQARFEAQNGSIVIDRDLRVTNQILFVSTQGMTQNLGTNIDAPQILFTGTGDFVLDQLNSIGNSGTPGDISAAIDGSLLIKNDFGINVASLTYTNKDGSTVDLVGVNIDNTTGSGDLKFDIDNSTVTQNADAPVISRGLTTFDVGNTGTVNLPFADTVPDLDLINENDFNQVAVDNGDIVEFNDFNTVTVIGAFTNNRLSVTSDTEDILLDGNIVVSSIVKFTAATGLSQTGGVVDTPNLMLMGQGYFDLSAPNQLGNGVPGMFAADVNGDINLVNVNPVQINSLGYTDLEGNAFTATGVNASGGGSVNSFRLRADGIQLHQRTVANTVVFETTAGISQFDTHTTDGLIDATNFSLVGTGFANLDQNNLIGTGTTAGNVAIDFEGDVRLNSLFAIDFDAVDFTFKSGVVRTDRDVDVIGFGGTAGNFELVAGGNITDAANIDIQVAGIGSFVANNGNSDIILGDAFSNLGGPNNITHFGSVGFKARNATVHEDSGMMLDGSDVNGNLVVSAFGDIIQTGNDPFSKVGTSALQVQGNATFLVDSDTLPTNHFNDTIGRDVLLMARDNDELIDNVFEGGVNIAGTMNTGGLNGLGSLRNVQFRNAAFEVSAFPMINMTNDALRSLSVWVPRSSAHISQDLDVLGSFTLFAGVDSVNGKIGGSLDVTNALLNRKITDEVGTSIMVGRNAVFEAGNTIILADHAGDTLDVGGRLQTSTHGGDAGSRIRVGIANSGARGNDSGAHVVADQLRFRAKPTTLVDSEHASFNIDKGVEIVGPNVARSLMLIADGNITDDSDADINVKNSTTLVAENDNDILLGESFSTNFINNNVHNFGTLAVKGRNVDIAEDSAISLDGVNVTGNFTITAMGNIRQAGRDRFGQIGTEFIKVGGDATFRVDQQQLPADQLNDTVGQDIKIMATPQQRLMDNEIDGEVIITSTDVDDSHNKKGSVRNVEIRNVSATAKDPIINIASSDRVRNLQIWTTRANLDLRHSYNVLNNFSIRVGVDSVNGLRNGRLQIVDNSAIRNLTDSVGVSLVVGNNADFRVANKILLADNAGDQFKVTNRTTLITLGGGQGNRIDVGTDINAARGTDSGAIFRTNTLKFRAPVTGQFGRVTVVADNAMTVTPDSQARSAVIRP